MQNTNEWIEDIRCILRKRWNNSEELLNQMVVKSSVDECYRNKFNSWLLHGSTLKLRELTRCFGDYVVVGTQLKFPNSVDAIDSAHHLAVHNFTNKLKFEKIVDIMNQYRRDKNDVKDVDVLQQNAMIDIEIALGFRQNDIA